MTTVAPKEKFVEANGLRLRYLDWGTEGKHPLVCLHGHTGQAHVFDEFAMAMAPSHHVLAVDQRGHGGSDWAGDGYARQRFVDDLAALIDALGLERVSLVGSSMGGWNSLLYAQDHPDRADRIVLIDIGPEPSAAPNEPPRTPTPMEFPSLEAAAAWARERNPWAAAARLLQDARDKMHQREDGQWTWNADPTLFTTPLSDMTDAGLIARYWKALETLTCPVLEVRGAGSPTVSDEVLARMHQANPRFLSVDIQNAGHVVPVDQPQEFIEATRAFLMRDGG